MYFEREKREDEKIVFLYLFLSVLLEEDSWVLFDFRERGGKEIYRWVRVGKISMQLSFVKVVVIVRILVVVKQRNMVVSRWVSVFEKGRFKKKFFFFV